MILRPRTLVVGAIAVIVTISGARAGANASPPLRVPANQRVDVLVQLPLRNQAELERLVSLQSRPGTQAYHRFLTPAQFAATFGPRPSDVSAVAAELARDGFTLARIGTQLIRASAPAATIERSFGTRLVAVGTGTHGRLTAAGALELPPALTFRHAIVAGLAGIPRPVPQLRAVERPANRYGPYGGYWFDDLKQAYTYPSYLVANGKGTHVAIVGYSDSSDSDAKTYFRHEKLGILPGTAVPTIRHFLYPGSTPFDPSSDTSLEADVDVQQAGGSAPGATIDLYAASVVSNESFLDTYATIAEDGVEDIVTTSYGNCELAYTPAYNGGQSYTAILGAYHQVFLQGNSEGITFLFSSGDDGGNVCPPAAYFTNAGAGVTYKAVPSISGFSDANATSVGGTTSLRTSYVKGSLESKYVTENSLADPAPFPPSDPYGTGNFVSHQYWGSGGGVSSVFGKPGYQQYVPYPRRAVPDISMHMGGCPFSSASDCNPTDSYDVAVFNGQLGGVIGTSLSSPEFAGLLATIESITKTRLANVNELLYAAKVLDPQVFHTGFAGSDGVPAYTVKAGSRGYNLVYGLGTPSVQALIHLLDPTIARWAGNPQTPSNP